MNLDNVCKLAAILIPLFGIIVPLYKFIKEKNLAQRDLRFRTYHQLIKDLVEPKDGNTPMRLDKQIAICFELRNFPEYFEVSRRILSGLHEQWSKERVNQRLLTEIQYTISYIDLYRHNRLIRFFLTIRNEKCRQDNR